MSKPKYSFQPLSGVPFASSALHRLVSPQLSLASHTTQPYLHPIVRKMYLLFCIAIIIKCCSEVNGRSYMTIAGVTITDEMVNVLQVKHSNNTAVRALADRSAKQSNSHRGISDLLDSLLQGYDNSIRPDFGGPPAEVEVDIMVRSMGPISEVDMTYSMDCYFRQSWVDRRLAFEGSEEPLALSVSMLRKIWKPDTYFYNGKQSYLHTITAPNKFVRLFQNGRVLYSSRLTIKAGCPMNLEDFPMDTQRCPLKFGSFGYTTKDVLYRWNGKRQVAIAEDMKLSQFDLVANPSANHTDLISLPNSEFAIREYSMLLVSFHLRRHMGNFLIQVYGPCILLVVLSWVSFWLNREATADRISLGITTVLTMTFLGLEARTDLPKVPYLTALDLFVFLSFAFIFATIIQFAIVHYFTKYGSGECYFSMEINSDVSSEEEPEVETWPEDMKAKPLSVLEVIPLSSYTIPIRHLQPRPAPKPHPVLSCCGSQDPVVPPREKRPTPATHVTHSPKAKPTTSTSRKLSITSVTGSISQAIRSLHSPRASLLGTIQKKRKKRTPRFNSVSKVDKVSRIFFPLLFAAINVFYWYCYLSRSQRMQRKSVMVT